MRKLVALTGALTLVLALSALPAGAQTPFGPPTVVDRTAVTLTYQPFGTGTSTFTGAVSYAFGPAWDLLVRYESNSGLVPTSVFGAGARYHLRPPSSAFDTYVSLQYASPSTGTNTILLGAGLTQTLAPGLKSYAALNYDTDQQIMRYDVGVQYQLNRQFSLVAGVRDFIGNFTIGYLGVSFGFGR